MILRNYRSQFSLAKLRNFTKTTNEGTTALGLKKAAEHFDLEVKAPISGVIHVLNPDSRSKLISTVNPLAQTYPELDNNKSIKLKGYISPNDISTVKKGQKLRLKIVRNVPTTTILEGTIKTISVFPITVDKNNYYVVEAFVKFSRKQINNLHYGMAGQR